MQILLRHTAVQPAQRALNLRLAPQKGRPDRRMSGGSRVHALSKQDELKQKAAWKAVEYVSSGMKLGLGTGSTAAFAVERIGDLLAKGELKDIIAVPTSIKTYEQAQSASTPCFCTDAQNETGCMGVPQPQSCRCGHPTGDSW